MPVTVFHRSRRRAKFRDSDGVPAIQQADDDVDTVTFDYEDELSGATISTSTWAGHGVTTSGAAIGTPAVTVSITVTGSPGYVENTVTTSDSRTLNKRTLRIYLAPRGSAPQDYE